MKNTEYNQTSDTNISKKTKTLLKLFCLAALLFILFVWLLVLLSSTMKPSFAFSPNDAILYTFITIATVFGIILARKNLSSLYPSLSIVCILALLASFSMALSFHGAADTPIQNHAQFFSTIMAVPVFLGGLALWAFVVFINLAILLNIWKDRNLFLAPTNRTSTPFEKSEISGTSTKPTSQNPLHLLEAIIAKDTETIRQTLADHPELLNTAYAQNGNTPLHVAVWNGHKDIVELLLAQPGIDTTRTNLAGKTALDLAKEKNFPEIIEMLKFTEQE